MIMDRRVEYVCEQRCPESAVENYRSIVSKMERGVKRLKLSRRRLATTQSNDLLGEGAGLGGSGGIQCCVVSVVHQTAQSAHCAVFRNAKFCYGSTGYR